jgi:pSer/pThr/pTyr-binding forkhead associated (FHA) protein
MSEYSTYDIGYTSPQRVRETVHIDDTVSHIDILLPFAEEDLRDGFRWVNSIRKTLRLSRIDERSLVLSDLSSIKGDHGNNPPAFRAEDDLPFDVMDIMDQETATYGRDHNPANLEILANPLVSREHLRITPYLGEAGLSLAFSDQRSTNGSGLVVVRHEIKSAQPLYDNLFVA